MSLSNQERLVCKVMTDRDIKPLLDYGVTPDWIPPGKSRDAIEFILNHYEKHGVVPSRATFSTQIGSGYRIVAVSESIEYLIQEQAKFNQYRLLKLMQAEIEDRLDDRNIDGAVSELSATVTALGRFEPRRTTVVNSMADARAKERWDEYQARKTSGSLLGMTTGFPTIDKTTLGLQPGQLVTVLAQPKVGKTSLCLAMANHIYRGGGSVLFVSFEMGIRELEMRQESLMAKINFRNLQNGKLTPIEEKKYRDYLDYVMAEYDHEFNFMDSSSGSSVGTVRTKIEQLAPSVVFIDGIYMMHDEVTGEVNTPQALTSITRSLKRLATQMKVPIVINTQALGWKSRGQKITMDSAGYSSSFAQDSDVILGLERIEPLKGEEDSDFDDRRELKILASRNTGLTRVHLLFDYSSGSLEEFVSDEEDE